MKPCKVVPYVANITTKETTATAANKPELLINDFAARGWAFESAEKFETVVDYRVIIISIKMKCA